MELKAEKQKTDALTKELEKSKTFTEDSKVRARLEEEIVKNAELKIQLQFEKNQVEAQKQKQTELESEIKA